MKLQLTSKT